MNERKKNDDEIGALWIKQGSKGEFLAGHINDQQILVFPNSYKKNDRHPDYRIIKSRPKPQQAPADDDIAF